jgi:hypothetical protein
MGTTDFTDQIILATDSNQMDTDEKRLPLSVFIRLWISGKNAFLIRPH